MARRVEAAPGSGPRRRPIRHTRTWLGSWSSGTIAGRQYQNSNVLSSEQPFVSKWRYLGFSANRFKASNAGRPKLVALRID
jgi:hypothetical protein